MKRLLAWYRHRRDVRRWQRELKHVGKLTRSLEFRRAIVSVLTPSDVKWSTLDVPPEEPK